MPESEERTDTAQALIYDGSMADFEVPKLGPVVKGVPRIVTPLQVANMGGQSVAEFLTMVKGFYNRGGAVNFTTRDLTDEEAKALADEEAAVAAAQDAGASTAPVLGVMPGADAPVTAP